MRCNIIERELIKNGYTIVDDVRKYPVTPDDSYLCGCDPLEEQKEGRQF